MQARRAARELALILFSQLDTITNPDKCNFQDIILSSVRTLTNSSIEDIDSVSKEIIDIKNYINSYEANHPQNLERPIGAIDKPVNIPTTKDMVDKLNILLDIADRTVLALEIAEMSTLEENSNVKLYIKRIVKEYKLHKDEINEQIKTFAQGWNIDRLVKMDRDILQIAICELLYIKNAPVKVIVDEAVELAKKYSTDDSASFVNGILAKVIIHNDLK